MFDFTKIDRSVDARTKRDSELKSVRTDTGIFKEEKIYKGAFCVGVHWVEYPLLVIKR